MSTTDYNADLDGVIKGILAHTPNLSHEQTEALNKQVYEKLSRIIDERVNLLANVKLKEYDAALHVWLGAEKMKYEQMIDERVKAGIVEYDEHMTSVLKMIRDVNK